MTASRFAEISDISECFAETVVFPGINDRIKHCQIDIE